MASPKASLTYSGPSSRFDEDSLPDDVDVDAAEAAIKAEATAASKRSSKRQGLVVRQKSPASNTGQQAKPSPLRLDPSPPARSRTDGEEDPESPFTDRAMDAIRDVKMSPQLRGPVSYSGPSRFDEDSLPDDVDIEGEEMAIKKDMASAAKRSSKRQGLVVRQKTPVSVIRAKGEERPSPLRLDASLPPRVHLNGEEGDPSSPFTDRAMDAVGEPKVSPDPKTTLLYSGPSSRFDEDSLPDDVDVEAVEASLKEEADAVAKRRSKRQGLVAAPESSDTGTHLDDEEPPSRPSGSSKPMLQFTAPPPPARPPPPIPAPKESGEGTSLGSAEARPPTRGGQSSKRQAVVLSRPGSGRAEGGRRGADGESDDEGEPQVEDGSEKATSSKASTGQFTSKKPKPPSLVLPPSRPLSIDDPESPFTDRAMDLLGGGDAGHDGKRTSSPSTYSGPSSRYYDENNLPDSPTVSEMTELPGRAGVGGGAAKRRAGGVQPRLYSGPSSPVEVDSDEEIGDPNVIPAGHDAADRMDSRGQVSGTVQPGSRSEVSTSVAVKGSRRQGFQFGGGPGGSRK
ncbi:hypothetical protein HDU96_003129 [Phlyctochytrium bullatum]|nr:hypothetical protein HDU96_003129 [Phlyctochytrium bullatum]